MLNFLDAILGPEDYFPVLENEWLIPALLAVAAISAAGLAIFQRFKK